MVKVNFDQTINNGRFPGMAIIWQPFPGMATICKSNLYGSLLEIGLTIPAYAVPRINILKDLIYIYILRDVY